MKQKFNFVINFILILFGLAFGRDVPKLSSGHALVGNYPYMNMETCGYINPQTLSNVGNRIIDGELSEDGEFPWHAAIFVNKQNDKKHICGGALIHRFWVLTAKKCFHPENENQISANNLIISLGSIKKTEFYSTYDVLTIFEHPTENMALLRLERAVLIEKNLLGTDYKINFICLPKQMVINTEHEDAIISGFGYIQTENHPPNNMLRKSTLLIDPFVDCDRRNIGNKYICATESVHMTCFEDLGSPLVQFDGNRAVVIGITVEPQSWDGRTCGMGVLIFFRVSYFIEWLEYYIANNRTTISPTIPTETRSTTELKKTTTVPIGSTTPIDEKQNKENLSQNLVTNIVLNLISISLIFSFFTNYMTF